MAFLTGRFQPAKAAYKDYMNKNSLTDDQKEVLEELMSTDTSTLYGSGVAGTQVAQMAMTKVGCGYSQDMRMQEGGMIAVL